MVTGLGIFFVGTTVCFEICIQNESYMHLFTERQATYKQTLTVQHTCVRIVHQLIGLCTASCIYNTLCFQNFIFWSVFYVKAMFIQFFYMQPSFWTVSAISLIRCLKHISIYQGFNFVGQSTLFMWPSVSYLLKGWCNDIMCGFA